ncbi:MAG: amidohydrolase family protein [Pseudomonadota bacterium]
MGVTTLIKNTRLYHIASEQLVDVRFGEQVQAIGQLEPHDHERVVDAGGGLLLPGLHDHHIHLAATVAARSSLDVRDVASFDEFCTRLQEQPPGPLRVFGYHESRLGKLDAARLDACVADHPVRVQHSTGKLWVCNSKQLQELALAEPPADGRSANAMADLERDAHGQPTGRLFRGDQWFAVRSRAPDLGPLDAELASYGVTGVSDASYTNDAAQANWLKNQMRCVNVFVMGDATVTGGPFKVMLDEDNLPELDACIQQVAAALAAGRVAAFHCVSYVELAFALAVLDGAGAGPGQRIEHGGLIDAPMVAELTARGCVVVTQPGFITDRGSRYRQTMTAAETQDLYRFRSLLAAGIPTLASSDAPYGPLNPWQIMAAGQMRLADDGQVLNEVECVTPEQALHGFLTHPHDPGGAARAVAVGEPADLCLLTQDWPTARRHLAEVRPGATWLAGRQTYSSLDAEPRNA